MHFPNLTKPLPIWKEQEPAEARWANFERVKELDRMDFAYFLDYWKEQFYQKIVQRKDDFKHGKQDLTLRHIKQTNQGLPSNGPQDLKSSPLEGGRLLGKPNKQGKQGKPNKQVRQGDNEGSKLLFQELEEFVKPFLAREEEVIRTQLLTHLPKALMVKVNDPQTKQQIWNNVYISILAWSASHPYSVLVEKAIHQALIRHVSWQAPNWDPVCGRFFSEKEIKILLSDFTTYQLANGNCRSRFSKDDFDRFYSERYKLYDYDAAFLQDPYGFLWDMVASRPRLCDRERELAISVGSGMRALVPSPYLHEEGITLASMEVASYL